tara:strand:+ start:290 stop:412 length:123 start_codon:yes stop_codon:yes gene_type:complete
MNITIEGITEGTHAVSIFHDEHKYNTLDVASVFRIPQEGF